MKDFCDIVKCLIIMECIVDMMNDLKYVFEVDICVNKIEIKKVVEVIFNVKVKNVNIFCVLVKFKWYGCYFGYISEWKKVFVILI